MRCSRVSENLIDYIEGGLRGRARSTIEAHLETCPECRKELALLQGTLTDLRGLDVEDPGDAFFDSLREGTYRRYLESRPSQRTDRVPFFERLGIRPLPAAAWATAGVAACVVAVLGVRTLLPGPATTVADLDVIIETARESDDLDTLINALPEDDIGALASLTVDIDAPEGTVGELLEEDTELALLDTLEGSELAALLDILEERYPSPKEDTVGKSSQAVISRKA